MTRFYGIIRRNEKIFFLKLLSGYILITVILPGAILLFSFGKIRGFYAHSLTRDLESVGAALRPTVLPLLEKMRYAELDAAVKKPDPAIHACITVIEPSGSAFSSRISTLSWPRLSSRVSHSRFP